ncbi:FMN-dependent NADH-azoreductase [Paenibacillus filicis]|uniref:FMN dependent NADH:quinone oxidoreductase n=1 Tax=Paenibacillus gyeongsangnamensis TaxID=3388067 RepID=A0ABT4Q1X5_9BACL|nr:FMN-dependent NADH-azoreductase [Paenibacillus filicis]MCZ8510894.1 FMN-dependent NADH-azoreductase [Paenibacillus filicis]
MSTVLFVKANNRPIEQAVSMQLYDSFRKAYIESHLKDTILELDLFHENLPYFDGQMLSGIFKAAQGMQLTSKEAELKDIADRYLDQFLSVDKIVFGFPLWNMTVPAVLLTYINYLSRAGKTFKYTSQGSIGLAGDKKVALLCARGGDYSEEPLASNEMAVNYVTRIMKLYGIHDITTVIIEGHHQYSDRSENIIQAGIRNARDAAKLF